MSKILLVCKKCGEMRAISTIARAKSITYCIGCRMRTKKKFPISIMQVSESDYKSIIKEQREKILEQTDVNINELEEEKSRQKQISAHKLLY